MRVTPTELPGVLLVEPPAFADNRGSFTEVHHAARYREAGIACPFVQDNTSRSWRHVVRGMHLQLRHPQDKLILVVRGAILDVAVDVRRGSPTFGRWVARELSDANHAQLFVPGGFAHGFCVLSEVADVLYKCSAPYAPGDEVGFDAFSPEVGIPWPAAAPIRSARDAALPALAALPPERLPRYAPAAPCA